MNPQYNRGPPGPYGAPPGGAPMQQGVPSPGGYGPPPPGGQPPGAGPGAYNYPPGMGPSAPQGMNMYNGGSGMPPRPSGQAPPNHPQGPGMYGGTMPPKNVGAPPQPISNGTDYGAPMGPQGDQQFTSRPGMGQQPVRGGPPAGFPPRQNAPPNQPQYGPGQMQNMPNQFENLSLNGPSSAGGIPNNVPPTSAAGIQQRPMGGPPTSQTGPPNSMGGPPNSMSGPPNSMSGPPNSIAGPPNSMGGPPNSMAGPMSGPPRPLSGPPNSMQGPPGSYPGPTTSMAGPGQSGGMPPRSMAGPGMPPMNPPAGQNISGPPTGGFGPPPTQPGVPMGGVPHSSAGGMPPPSPGNFGPPGSVPNQYGQGPPQGGMPPSGPPGMPPGPPGPGMTPPVSQPGGMPPPGPGAPYSGFNSPQPGYNQQRASGPVPGQPQQPRRLDPDHMPSPIQVIEDDKRNRGGLFQTGQRGLVPPLVTTSFIAEDQGNCNPRFMRSTMYNVPCTSDMMKQCHVPFALSITPFAKLHPNEEQPPLVDLGQLGPVRCNRCKAYMCPNMLFIDGGRRFQCCFCTCSTEVPPEYFAHLDHTGRRVDAYDRPELCLGSYEFVATTDYCRDNKLPKPPAFIFMIDVSYNSVKSGLVQLLCERLKEDILVNLPKEHGADESEIRVGFVTYAKEIHFYNVKGNLAQPQMLVVSDVQDVFVPLLDGFMVKLSEAEAVIDSLLAQIPQMFAESKETEIVLGPVIQAGLEALKAAECAGKLFVFHSSLPTANAPGKLKSRDDRKVLGTDKEKSLLTPQSTYYTKLGQDCVAAGCGVDLFLFPNSYLDIASIGEVPRLTGGQIYKYTYFQADLDGNRLMDDLKDNVQRPIAFDGIMRVRTSTGIRPVDFLGNFYMSNTTDVELAVIDCNKSITVEVKHDDKLSEGDGAYIQCALLYTSIGGQRRLRVINMALNCCTQMADLFRNCELDVFINYMSKLALRENVNTSPKQVREHIMNQCAHVLACYRKHCASPSSEGQLILPECMKLLPVYSNCVLKSSVLQGGTEIMTDDRSFLMNLVNSMPVKDTNVFFYPRLLPLHDIDTETNVLPTAMRCSFERLREEGVYLLENGLTMYMWIGINVTPEWVQSVFGVQSAAQIDIDKQNPKYKTQLQDLDNPLSRRVRGIVKRIREERNRHMKLIIVRQRDKLEPVFQQYLVEDRGVNGTASYVDFLCHIHKEIRSLLS